MANKKSALKAIRKGKKLQEKNSKLKDNLKWLVKKAEKAISEKSDKAREFVKQLEKAVDKAVQKGVLKENTGRRRKSRIMAKFNIAFSDKKSAE